MTGAELRAIRRRIHPGHGGGKAMALALGYKDARAYLRYERGERPVPQRLAVVARIIAAKGMPPS
jgi:hypothetical protein